MLYLILVVISIGVLVYGLTVGEDELAVVSIFGIIIFGIVSLSVVFSGVTTYVYLDSKKIEIQTLEKGIVPIRASYYKVIGSKIDLTNMKQSTVLSEYIEKVYEAKAEYNKKLRFSQISEERMIFIWLMDGFFISSDVQKLKLVE